MPKIDYDLVLEDYTTMRTEYRDNWGEPGQHQIEVPVQVKRYRFTILGITMFLRPIKQAELYADLYAQMIKAENKYLKNQNPKKDEKLKYQYYGRVYELDKLHYVNTNREYRRGTITKSGDPVGDPVQDALKNIFPNRKKQ